MPFKASAGRRHHIPKQRHRVTNFAAYDSALRQHGSLTVWFTDAAIAAWKAEPRTTRGGQSLYSALAIATALTLRAVFRLALRQTECKIACTCTCSGTVLEMLPRASAICSSVKRRVRAWRAEHGADREVIFRQDHVPGQQGLSDFTDVGDFRVSIARAPPVHRLCHFTLAHSAWEHAEPVIGGESSPRLRSACRTHSGRWAPRRSSTAPTACRPRSATSIMTPAPTRQSATRRCVPITG